MSFDIYQICHINLSVDICLIMPFDICLLCRLMYIGDLKECLLLLTLSALNIYKTVRPGSGIFMQEHVHFKGKGKLKKK